MKRSEEDCYVDEKIVESCVKELKSIIIDFENKVFLLNGEPMDTVRSLHLEADGSEWSLTLCRDEIYEAPFRKSKNM